MNQTKLYDWMDAAREPENKREDFHNRERARYEQLKKEVRNARMALLQAGVKEEEINVESLPGDIVGKTEAMGITVDPVIFRDLTFATHTLGHEKAHKEGITNEGLAELAAILKSKDKVMPEYTQTTENVKKIANVIGLQTTLDMYKKEQYEWMFKIFVSKSMKKNKSYSQCMSEFEKAFPELEILSMKN